MLYLFVSIALIAAAAGLYFRYRIHKQPLPRSTQVILAVFFVAGVIMTYVSLMEIGPSQYAQVEKVCREFPELARMVDERRPLIRRYEYLEILEAHRKTVKSTKASSSNPAP
jgi:hypothetical protein